MQPSDERRHEPRGDAAEPWAETWEFDFFSPHGDLGGWSSLTLWPKENLAWYHAFLAGPDRDLVAVVDHEVPLPPSILEIRTHGLWASHICETPFDHWTIGLEAFGVGLDDPAEMYGRQMGDQVALGFDLEWEAEVDPPFETLDSAVLDGYWQGCRVSGEVLVGEGAIDFDGHGARYHQWGPVTPAGTIRVTARLTDGEWVTAEAGPGNGDTGLPGLAPMPFS